MKEHYVSHHNRHDTLVRRRSQAIDDPRSQKGPIGFCDSLPDSRHNADDGAY